MSLRRLSIAPFILCVHCVLCGKSPSAAERPNIIFILADDLGYGDLGCYGQPRILTPRLDRMAAEGMRFTGAYSGFNVCAPSRSVLMTGQHTGHTRVRSNGSGPLQPEDITVAELLKAQGYATCLIGKWGLGDETSTGAPWRQGFDHFFGYLDQGHAHNFYPGFLLRNDEKVMLRNVNIPSSKYGGLSGVATVRIDYSHDLFAAEALEWIDAQVALGKKASPSPARLRIDSSRSEAKRRDEREAAEGGKKSTGNRERRPGNTAQPFFLYLAFTIPHANNQAQAGKDGEGDPGWKVIPEQLAHHRERQGMEVPDAGDYQEKDWPGPQKGTAAMISRLDADVGRILDRLASHGIDENTLVFFSSDNGPHKEGGNDPYFFTSMGPLQGYKRSWHDGGIRVPMIARWPGKIAAGKVNDAPWYFADFLPTALDLLDLDPPENIDGLSILPTLLGEAQPGLAGRFLYWGYAGDEPGQVTDGAVRYRNWKAVITKGDLALYDLATDIAEKNDVVAAHPDIVQKIKAYLATNVLPESK